MNDIIILNIVSFSYIYYRYDSVLSQSRRVYWKGLFVGNHRDISKSADHTVLDSVYIARHQIVFLFLLHYIYMYCKCVSQSWWVSWFHRHDTDVHLKANMNDTNKKKMHKQQICFQENKSINLRCRLLNW